MIKEICLKRFLPYKKTNAILIKDKMLKRITKTVEDNKAEMCKFDKKAVFRNSSIIKFQPGDSNLSQASSLTLMGCYL
jgi:hypothetical protein